MATAMNRDHPLLGSLSAVVVVDDAAPDLAQLTALSEMMVQLAADTEIVLVATGVSSQVALGVAAIVDALPDVTSLFLPERLHRDTARLVGMAAALGDWVLLVAPTAAEIAVLPSLVERTCAGIEIVIGEPTTAEAVRGGVYSALARSYFWLFNALTDQQLRWPAPAMRLYSRAAALYVGSHPSGEMLLRSDSAIGGFPADRIPLPTDAAPPATQSTRSAIGHGLRSLVASSSAPLRLATAVAIVTGLLSLLYSLYVVIVYFVVSDVAAGWTTLSLQTAGMMFLLSIILGILSEYVIAIYHSLAPRGRHVVARELRSQRRRDLGRLNVVDADGAFRLGASPERGANDADPRKGDVTCGP